MELRALLLLLLLCFPGLQAKAPHAEERQREGGTLHIQCPYADETRKQEWKVWCRLRDERCYENAVATNSEMSQTRDRVTIKDDPTAKTVSVTMTGLQAQDSGTYFCAVSLGHGYYSPLKTISLNVFKEVLLWELDTLWLKCPYNIWGQSTTWCRREGQTKCGVMASTDYSTRSNSRAPHDRTSITNNNYQGAVTVTMKKLQAQDSGTYWCALRSGRTRVMEVVLSVFKRTQQYTAEESGNVSVRCLYKNTDYGAVSKAWCKEGAGTPCEILVTTSSEASGNQRTSQDGRVRIQDDTQRGIVTITMEQLQTQDSGVYWCALHETSGPFRMEEVTLKVSKALADTEGASQATPLGNSPALSSNGSTFISLSVVLSILLILALITSVTLCVRLHKLLERTGNRGAKDTYGNSEGTAQLGRTERRESSKDDSKGLKHMNLDLQSRPSPEDPLYCNIEASQAPRNPHGENVEYAVIAFNQFPRNDAG
ncbi:polymeric immunoglobulin receptor-like isoform X2 [Empidonax traillii]|uniref:polymeric immunoglobulin receptor-like isoform X2 n=1 Tax=Empidonax traillii TaxID=164674 RepID=UPI000FFCEB32|nr:polymeric immunoglobulin receptor-like isoform X2 [Empidonax traillii]